MALKNEPEVILLIEKAVTKAVVAARRDAAKILKDVSDELMESEGLAKDFIRAHKAFVQGAVARIKGG